MKTINKYCVAFICNLSWQPRRIYINTIEEAKLIQEIIHNDVTVKRATLFNVSPDNKTLTTPVMNMSISAYRQSL